MGQSAVRIACIQMEPVVGDKDANLRQSLAIASTRRPATGRG